ncbi:MAG: endonuclease/exonuclease/phosphatase family protein [Candidatus Thiodiazotropha taylori]|nr:endonuclease/exonuclease/phosphatase family protein [Candidatus Thiodiazotropha taylori]MCG8046602.1 endonuclease/exonuclease/phosphatase family protein [Candidatus Thiodiazotropha taylori]MCW4333977.1 reverse transcriptase domain-containing protein [Candidatus Thiodiazotropha endolucinida]MCW4344314.1 reverse transcriptase domain-containing protein [Candidatus Thiodiazotropha endolucinida]
MSSAIFNSLQLNHHLSFVQYNVQSISNKLDVLHAELFEFDILAFTETWLSPTTNTDSLLLQSYNTPERRDRLGDAHGGVIVYVKEGIRYKRRNDLEIGGIECIWIEVANTKKKILFGLFYRAPNSDANYYSNIEDSIALAIDTGIADILITGDFNFNYLDLQTRRKIDSLCTRFSLHQTICQPTHYTEHSSSLIDIILVSNKEHIILSGVGDPFLNQQMRYHCPIFGILKFAKPRLKSFDRHIWDYKNGNYHLLREKASAIDWNSLIHENVDIYSNNLKNSILSIAKECIPNRTIKVKPSDPPWLTSFIKRHIRKRKRAYKKALRSNLERHWTKFRALRNQVITIIRDSKQTYFDKMADKLKSDSLSSKDWWATLKTFITPNFKSVMPPIEAEGRIYTDDTDKATVLNTFFQGQSQLNDTNAFLPNLPEPSYHTNLSTITLTPPDVQSTMQSLKVGKASGPDGISNHILRELSNELSSPFCTLFNQSLRYGIFPTSYKDANVSPVPKKGDLSIASNYRPISLLNSEAKVFERLVFKHLFNHLQNNNILSSLQSGFMPGDSTVNQLTFLYHTFCEALDAGKEVRAVFCDISKAFDRVWHKGLVFKLKAAGVTGSVLHWFNNYLSDRRQRVVLPGGSSDWTFIRAGVPQGSILGPLLFLLYINDIVNDIGSNIRLFADDTSLFIIVNDPVSAATCLNSDLDKISRWAATWLVAFNPSKSAAFLMSRKLIKPNHPPLFMQNIQIDEVNSHKHLGLYFSQDCSWHKQIDYIKEKAWFRVNVMRKLKFKLDRKSLETIYIAFIRPILEYADVIWDNCTQYEKNELEKIQIEAARIVTGSTILVSLNKLYQEVCWDTLQQRRFNHKLTLFYKMSNNLAPTYLSTLVPRPVSTISRYNLRNSDNLQTIRANTNLYYNSFLPSTLREWNKLPAEVRQLPTLNSFKYYLSKDRRKVPKHYYHGNRKAQVLHTRLRTGCSSLNIQLFMKNIIDSPLCPCGSIENPQHYFFHCGLFQAPRTILLNAVEMIQTPSLNLLLYGDSGLSHEANCLLFEHVQKFIVQTKRF